MSLKKKESKKGTVLEQEDKTADELKQKLNEAMASYFFEGTSERSKADASPNKEALFDIVKEGLAANRSSIEIENAIGEEVAPVPEEPANGYFEDEPDTPANDAVNTAPDYDAKLFSGAFDEIEYQSIEIEIVEDEPSIVPEGDSSRYAQIVKNALNSSPKQIVPTVLESEPPVRKAVLPGTCPTSPSKNNKLPFSMGPEKELVRPEEKNNISNRSRMDGAVTPPEETVSQVTGPVKTQRSEKIVEKPKRTLSSSIFSKKEPVLSSDMKKKDVIKSDLSQKPAEEDHASEVVLLYNEKHLEHDPSSLSIKAHENPDRLLKAMWYLEKSGVFRNGQCTLMGDFDMASESDLLRVHDESYIEFIRSYSSAGGGFLGDSTYMTSRSYEITKLAAGAAIKAGSLVADGKYSYAFVMTRPPGHHASGNKYGGFCLFNNVAILARYLQEKKHVGKIMIIDWDAHAGDGTMEIFYKDPTVLFVSLHRDPHGFYPRKGFSKETGDESGKGYTVNVEMPVGAGDDEYSLAFEEVVIPLMQSFSPEFIICSCGFDAYYKEKNIGLSLTSDGFHRMTSLVRSLYPKNFVLLMEGGYHDFNGQLCHSVISALQDVPNPVNDKPEMSSFKKNQQQQILMETKAKIAEVKKLIPMLM